MGVIEVRDNVFATPSGAFKVGTLAVQFSFKHEKNVPECVRQLEPETVDQRLVRKSTNTGYKVFNYTLGVDASELPAILQQIGFVMVGAYHQRRPDVKGSGQYSAVRFVFARQNTTGIVIPQEVQDAFASMVNGVIWRMRGYANPNRDENGEIIPGEFKAMFCFEARQPLTHEGDKPVMVYDRDQTGERVEGSGRPLKAMDRLIFQGGRIFFAEC